MPQPPIIGLSLDFEQSSHFSDAPHYCLRTHYFDAVVKAGGIPLGLGYYPEQIPQYIDLIDALIVPGGDFALDPSWYIQNNSSPFEASPRLQFDTSMITAALNKNIPVLGICAGMQTLACMHGCKLSSSIENHKHYPRTEYAHDITIEHNTLLHHATNASTMPVNSVHVEAITQAPDNVIVSARSMDGTIEAIELPQYRFALGIQWHPEFFLEVNNPNYMVFQKFIAAANTNRT
tara:strand:- start:36 stop:737 length:702 start_codon:yes stop_codon:yes gene_type:complete